MPEIVGTLKPPRLNTAPTSPALGQMYYDIPSNTLKSWNGTAWISASQGPMGPQGPSGPQGPPGPSVVDDTNLPARLKSNTSYIADCNADLGNGWYGISPSTLNRPPGATYGYLQVQQLDGQQTQYSWSNYAGDGQWERRKSDGGWSAWSHAMRPQLWGLNAMAPNNDANLATVNGWSFTDPSGINVPPGGNWWKLFTINMNVDGNCTQTAWRYDSDEMWFRRRTDNNWQVWKKISPIDDVNLPARLQTSGPTISDFNSPAASGWYRPNNATNGPAGATPYGMLWHNAWDTGNGHAAQIFQPMYDNTLWLRRCVTYVWQGWTKIYPIDDSNLPDRITSDGQFTGDFNNAKAPGFYRGGGGTTNGPPTSYGEYSNVLVLGDNDQQIGQLGLPFWNPEVWYRRCHSGTWQPWVKIYPAIVDDTNLPARLADQSTYLRDLNNIGNGFFAFDPSTPNRPANVWGYGIAIGLGSGGNQRQYAWNYSVSNVGSQGWWRSKNDGNAWTAWVAMEVVDGAVPLRLAQGGQHGLTDFNAATQGGFYNISNGANAPFAGSHFHLYVSAHSTSYLSQIAISLYSETMHFRRCVGGSWGGWQQVYPASASIPDTGWQNFTGYSNNYSGMGAPWGPPQFRRLGNVVFFRGLIQSWGSGNTETISSIPGGYRPSINMMFDCRTNSGSCRMDIYPDGALRCDSGSPDAWISVNEISFPWDGN